jgi:hypothetical protein
MQIELGSLSYMKLIHKDKVNNVRSEVTTAANMKINIWDMTPRSFGLNRNIGKIPFHPHLTIQMVSNVSEEPKSRPALHFGRSWS